MHDLAHVATALALLASGMLLGGTSYDAVVLAPNLRGGPNGLEHGRQFMAAATPARLFRVLSPASQLLALAAAAMAWPDPASRWPLLGAVVALVACDAITFKFHYPRNRLLFAAPLAADPAALDRAAREWAAGNWVRVALVLIAWLAILAALVRSVG